MTSKDQSLFTNSKKDVDNSKNTLSMTGKKRPPSNHHRKKHQQGTPHYKQHVHHYSPPAFTPRSSFSSPSPSNEDNNADKRVRRSSSSETITRSEFHRCVSELKEIFHDRNNKVVNELQLLKAEVVAMRNSYAARPAEYQKSTSGRKKDGASQCVLSYSFLLLTLVVVDLNHNAPYLLF